MKRAILSIPAYLPPSHAGATPTPYQSGTVDKFENLLAAHVLKFEKHMGITIMVPDPGGRWVKPQIVTQYIFVHDPLSVTLGQAISLALKTFNIPEIEVTNIEAQNEMFNAEGAETIAAGLHAWDEE